MPNATNKKAKGSTKAARKLSNISFEDTGAHLALVSKEQGGPANGYAAALVMKSAKGFSEEIIEKVQQVRVTMELPEFLSKFFYMYSEDALVLAKVLGYEPQENDEIESYMDYIDSRVSSIELMKSLYEADSIASAISGLQEEDFLAVLQDQEVLEKVLQSDTSNVTKEETPSERATVVNKGQFVSFDAGVGQVIGTTDAGFAVIREFTKNASGNWEPTETLIRRKPKNIDIIKVKQAAVDTNITTQKEVKMSKETEEVTVEVISKSQFEAVQGELAESRTELQKALDEIAVFKAEKEKMIKEARMSALGEVVKDKEQRETLFKAMNRVESDEEFVEVLDVLKAIMEAKEASELFTEVGEDAEAIEKAAGDKSDALTRLLQSKFHAKK